MPERATLTALGGTMDNSPTARHVYHNPPTAQEWVRVKPLLADLYVEKRMKLAAIMELMRTEHGFIASARMFKKRFAAWGIERKLKLHEVKYMIVLEYQRSNSKRGTQIWLRDRQVSPERIAKYVRKRGLKVSQIVKENSNGLVKPCDWIRCSTPAFDEPRVLTPAVYDPTQKLYQAFRLMITTGLEYKFCFAGNTGLVWVYRDDQPNDAIFQAFEVFQDFNHYSRSSIGRRELWLLRRGCRLLEDTMQCPSFLWWRLFIKTLASLIDGGHQKLAQILLDHVRSLAHIASLQIMPHSAFLRNLPAKATEDLVQVSLRLYELIADFESEMMPHNNQFSWESRVDVWSFKQQHCKGFIDREAFRLMREGIELYDIHIHHRMTDRLIDEAGWQQIELQSWYKAACASEGLVIEDADNPFAETGTKTSYDVNDPLTFVADGFEHFKTTNFRLAQAFWCHALSMPTRKELTLSSAAMHHILDYLDWISTVSCIADGNLFWRSWKRYIEEVWEREVEVECCLWKGPWRFHGTEDKRTGFYSHRAELA